jgi:starch-binding outer membrane protein, SusD/RagB family
MKKLKLIYILFILLVASGCSKFLEEDNRSNIPSDEYYTTPEGYESIVNASYSSLRNIYAEPWLFSAGTDLFVEGRNAQPQGISKYLSLSPDEPDVEDFYRAAFRGIQISNTALYFNDKASTSSTLTAERLAERKGEVQFLRAYVYFLLVQQFGGVSIVTERFTEPVPSFKRNSAQEVYDFVIKEMNEALLAVPEIQVNSTTDYNARGKTFSLKSPSDKRI